MHEYANIYRTFWEHSEELPNFCLRMLFNIRQTLTELSFRTQI